MRGLANVAVLVTALALGPATAQVLEFESGGLKYQALTRGGVTVMIAVLPTRVLNYSILQVAITNASGEPQQVRPEKFQFHPTTGRPIQARTATAVVDDVMRRGGRNDVGRLVGVYEAAIFGNSNLELRHGYEARRKDAMAVGGGTRMKAAAAAAAILLGSSKLESGQSNDGAVFLPTSNRPLGAGTLTFEIANQVFEFKLAADPAPAR